MKHKFYKTIKGRFLIITTVLILIVGAGASTMAYALFSQNLRDNQLHAAETNLQFLKNSIDADMIDVMNLSRTSRTSSNILNFVNTSRDSAAYNTITRNAIEWLNEQYLSNNATRYIDRIVVANVNRTDYLQVVSPEYSVGKPLVQLIEALPYYEELMAESDYTFRIGIQKDPFRPGNSQMFPVIRPIYDTCDNSIIGFSYLQISFQLFTEPLAQYSEQTKLPVYLTIAGTTWKITKDSIQTVSFDPGSIQDIDFQAAASGVSAHSVNAGGEQCLFVSTPLDTHDCSLAVPIPNAAFYEQLKRYLAILSLILLFMLAIGIFLVISLNRTVTRPIARLHARIDAVAKEEFAPDLSVEWDNELGDIGKNINRMAMEIQNLMEEKIHFETQKKDYEYQVLQSQINPHFLYNTLNSIKWMAAVQHAPGIAEMTTALAHLLKYIAKGTSTIVTLADEIELLDEYFTIQKYRYGGTITLEYQIEDEALLQTKILRFTLQPIVENSIFHGIEPKGQSGTITVHVCRVPDNCVQIDITDDGVGMEEEELKQILNEASPEKTHFFRQIGIGSVNKRIQYNFGREYGLFASSVPGQYTTMSVRLPETQTSDEN